MDHTIANTDSEMDQHISRRNKQPRCTTTLQDSNNNQTEMDRSNAEQFQKSNAHRQQHAQTQQTNNEIQMVHSIAKHNR